jgi:hypothetical protein
LVNSLAFRDLTNDINEWREPDEMTTYLLALILSSNSKIYLPFTNMMHILSKDNELARAHVVVLGK